MRQLCRDLQSQLVRVKKETKATRKRKQAMEILLMSFPADGPSDCLQLKDIMIEDHLQLKRRLKELYNQVRDIQKGFDRIDTLNTTILCREDLSLHEQMSTCSPVVEDIVVRMGLCATRYQLDLSSTQTQEHGQQGTPCPASSGSPSGSDTLRVPPRVPAGSADPSSQTSMQEAESAGGTHPGASPSEDSAVSSNTQQQQAPGDQCLVAAGTSSQVLKVAMNEGAGLPPRSPIIELFHSPWPPTAHRGAHH